MKPNRAQQRGSAAVEVTLLVPVLCLLLLLLAACWRIGWARTQLVEVVAAGARAATIPHTATAATAMAQTAIRSDLATSGVQCAQLSVAIDTAAYHQLPGTAGRVEVQATCRLDLADLLLPGLPGSMTLSASAHEPLDIFRERTP